MSDAYEYRTVRIERGAWRRFSESVAGPLSDATRESDGVVFALFAGVIGFATDEGVLIRAWPDTDALVQHADRTLGGAAALVESSVERLAPTVRPLDATPPRETGVYAHRWFWLQPQDWPEFVRLSEDGIWPYFESDNCRIIGLWRSIEPGPLAKALLVTRYPSVAHWERTRLQSPDAPPGADERLYRAAQEAGRRRAEITQRSVVRLTRLVVPPDAMRT